MRALMGDVVPPASKLDVQIVDVQEGPRGKERVAEVLNLAFDLALLIAPTGRTRPRGEVIVTGELEQAGMEADRGAGAFEDGAAQIVVHEGPRDARPRLKRLDMAAQKTLEGLVDGE